MIVCSRYSTKLPFPRKYASEFVRISPGTLPQEGFWMELRVVERAKRNQYRARSVTIRQEQSKVRRSMPSIISRFT